MHHAFLNFFVKFVFLLVNNLLQCCLTGHCTHHFLSFTAFLLLMSLDSKKRRWYPFTYNPNPVPNPCCTWSATKAHRKNILVIWIDRRYEVQWLNWGKICAWFLMSLRVLGKIHPMVFASAFLLWKLKLYFQKYAGLLWFLHTHTDPHTHKHTHGCILKVLQKI